MGTAYGIQKAILAKLLKIDVETLTKYYSEEIETGRERATMVVASKLFKTATNNSLIHKNALQAQIFWLRTRGGGAFIEKQQHELSGPDGTPIQTQNILTDEERATRLFQLINTLPESAVRQLTFERDGGMVSTAGATDARISKSG
jgi:hypothetical protein